MLIHRSALASMPVPQTCAKLHFFFSKQALNLELRWSNDRFGRQNMFQHQILGRNVRLKIVNVYSSSELLTTCDKPATRSAVWHLCMYPLRSTRSRLGWWLNSISSCDLDYSTIAQLATGDGQETITFVYVIFNDNAYSLTAPIQHMS